MAADQMRTHYGKSDTSVSVARLTVRVENDCSPALMHVP